MYKVTYSTYAKMSDGTICNINHGTCIQYTNISIKNIEEKINIHLEKHDCVCNIEEIIRIGEVC